MKQRPFDIRRCLVETAKLMCSQVTEERDQPCRQCVYNASRMHSEFVERLPPEVLGLTPGALSAAIRDAGVD